MSTADFCKENRISMTAEYASDNPNMADKNWQANHYKVTLRRAGRRMTTYFSCGLGISHEPTAPDVLDCLASDAAGMENARSFEDWAGEYGYDTDSRTAERTFKKCERAAAKLRAFLGSLYQPLLWDTERN